MTELRLGQLVEYEGTEYVVAQVTSWANQSGGKIEIQGLTQGNYDRMLKAEKFNETAHDPDIVEKQKTIIDQAAREAEEESRGL